MDTVKDTYAYITDKAQKLTMALYRVTDLMSDKEPIKWALRDKAVSVYNCIVSIKLAKEKIKILKSALEHSYSIIKSLELVPMNSFVSNINFDVLKKEYAHLKNLLESKETELVFDFKILPELAAFKKKSKETTRPHQTYVNEKEINEPNGALADSQVSADKMFSGRKNKILEFLKNGEAKMAGEIFAVFGGEVGAKTIQRDLLVLVKNGKIAAIGDKRWRKYEIIAEKGRENRLLDNI